MKDRAGPNNPNWRGGRRRGGEEGRYVMLYAPDHPAAVLGAVLEHRLVAEAHLGRFLRSDEVVHHVNEDTTDNRWENLQVTTQAEHARVHDTLAGKRYVRPPVLVSHQCERCGSTFVTRTAPQRAQRFCGKPCYFAYRTGRGQLHKGDAA